MRIPGRWFLSSEAESVTSICLGRQKSVASTVALSEPLQQQQTQDAFYARGTAAHFRKKKNGRAGLPNPKRSEYQPCFKNWSFRILGR